MGKTMKLGTVLLLSSVSIALAQKEIRDVKVESRLERAKESLRSEQAFERERKREAEMTRNRARLEMGEAGRAKLGSAKGEKEPIHTKKPLVVEEFGKSLPPPIREVQSAEELSARMQQSKLHPEVREAIELAQVSMLKAMNGDPVQVEGFLARESEYLHALGQQTRLSTSSARLFLRNILRRISGAKEAGENETPDRKTVETVKSLVCPRQCGHRGMALACRTIARFLEAAKSLAPAAFSICLTNFLAMDTEGKETVNVKTGIAHPSSLRVTQLDQPVDEEIPAVPGEPSP